ncbi:MAG TPA: citrate/2-methylcitrate synthase, partial [Chloroflexota bacterium]
MAQASVASKGLEGVTATTSAISSIIGSTLTYRGIDINELAEHSTFEEVAYLLYFGELPDRAQLGRFIQQVTENRSVSNKVLDAIRGFPRDGNAMVALRTAVSALAFYDPRAEDMSEQANQQKAIRLL